MSNNYRATNVQPLELGLGSDKIIKELSINGTLYKLDSLYICTAETTYNNISTIIASGKQPIFIDTLNRYYTLQTYTAEAYYFQSTATDAKVYQVICYKDTSITSWVPECLVETAYIPLKSTEAFISDDEHIPTTKAIMYQIAHVDNIAFCTTSTSFAEVKALIEAQKVVIFTAANLRPAGSDKGFDASLVYVGCTVSSLHETTYQFNGIISDCLVTANCTSTGWTLSYRLIQNSLTGAANINDLATIGAVNTGLSTKQDLIADLATIRSNATAGAQASSNFINYRPKLEQDTIDATKQAVLVSGTNIKTINNESILGAGNIDISFIVEYEVTTIQDIKVAYENNKVIFVSLENTLLPLIAATITEEMYKFVFAGLAGSNTSKVVTAAYSVPLARGVWTQSTQDNQAVLISGTNIKSINSQSILGSGNMEIPVTTFNVEGHKLKIDFTTTL